MPVALLFAFGAAGCVAPDALLAPGSLNAPPPLTFGAMQGSAVAGEIGKAGSVRAGPGSEHAVTRQLAPGTSVLITNVQDTWYEIQVVGQGIERGWVPHDMLRVPAVPGRGFPARATTHLNVRSGPGTGHNSIGVLQPGTEIMLTESQNGWYRAYTSHGVGWVYGNYAAVQSLPTVQGPTAFFGGSAPTAASQPLTGQAPVMAGQQSLSYAGYSRDVQPVKTLVRQGSLESAADLYGRLGNAPTQGSNSSTGDTASSLTEKNEENVGAETALGFRDPLLSALEKGTLALDGGDISAALEHYTLAEDILEGRRSGTVIGGLLRGIGNFLVENVSGREEAQPYGAEGFEKVLMLNYKTIGYLLEGKREAYNVSRRASDWQELERQAFEERIEKASGEKREASGEEEAVVQESITNTESLLQEAYADGRSKASEVKSAYVNPFGYYVVGMVNEFESRADPSLRDNARIAYEKALELNPSSEVLRQSVAAIKTNGAGRARIVHVVAGIGFAPEKKTLTYGLPLTQYVVPVKVPVYHRTPSRVARVEVRVPGGGRLATLSPLADVEAIALRHQEDSKPLEVLRVGVTVARSTLEKAALQQIKFVGIGAMLSDMRDGMTTPDMRSWQTLPANLHAARLELPANVSRLELRSYDDRGTRLASTTIDIEPRQHGFVYARSVDGALIAHSSPIRWLQSAQ